MPPSVDMARAHGGRYGLDQVGLARQQEHGTGQADHQDAQAEDPGGAGGQAQRQGGQAEDGRADHGAAFAVAVGQRGGRQVGHHGADADQGHDQAGLGRTGAQVTGAEGKDRVNGAFAQTEEQGRAERRQGDPGQAEGIGRGRHAGGS